MWYDTKNLELLTKLEPLAAARSIQDEELVAAVEAFPAVSDVSAAFDRAIAAGAKAADFAPLLEAEPDALASAQSLTAAIRKFAPAILMGSGGKSAADAFDGVVKLCGAMKRSAPAGGKASGKKRKHA